MKILYITTIGVTMGFFKSFIKELVDAGNTVEIAANENGGDTPVPDCYKEWGCRIYPVSCSRSPLRIENSRAVKEIRRIVSENKYDIVHCHTPVAAACTRLACRALRKKMGTRVFYTAHGFHFYTGAPLQNWVVYYPAEWVCSWWTDTLITINKEDYSRAKKHLHAKRTVYVPGVGIDTEKFAPGAGGRKKIRTELGIDDSRIMLLSVGELNENKNHVSVIRAIKGTDYVYVIVGKGGKKDELENAAGECGADVRLVGFRSDVADFYDAADVYVLPSIREGLNVSLMEAMASGLPAACGNIRGNVDLISEEEVLFDPADTAGIRRAIDTAVKNRTKYGSKNLERVRQFDLSTVEGLALEVYRGR